MSQPIETTSPVFNKPKGGDAFEDSDNYVEIDGFKFKLNEDDHEEVTDDESSHINSRHEQLKTIEKPKTRSKTAKTQTKKLQKQQKQREEQQDQETIQELTIKVLDRELKLTRLNMNEALYSLCRAWLLNQQESKYVELDYLFTQHVKRPSNGLKILKGLFEDEISCISLMPAPLPKELSIEVEASNEMLSRIPSPEVLGSQHKQNKAALDDIIKRLEISDPAEIYPSHTELLAEHLNRWKQVKVNWKKHTRAYDETHYGVNFAILDTMFKMQMQKNSDLYSNEILS